MIFFPAIDILDGQAVRLAQGSYSDVTSYNSDPVSQAKIFADAGAKWIHIVDLDGAKNGTTQNHKIIEKIISDTHIDVEVGGGIRSLSTIEKYVNVGAKRIVLGTKLATDPEFVKEALKEFGSYLVAGIDAKAGKVAVHGWTQSESIDAFELVSRLKDMGIYHLAYTDISRDGMQTGIDTNLYSKLAEVAGFGVVASGGVASIKDICALSSLRDKIEGVIAGRAIYENALDVGEALRVCAGGADSLGCADAVDCADAENGSDRAFCTDAAKSSLDSSEYQNSPNGGVPC